MHPTPLAFCLIYTAHIRASGSLWNGVYGPFYFGSEQAAADHLWASYVRNRLMELCGSLDERFSDDLADYGFTEEHNADPDALEQLLNSLGAGGREVATEWLFDFDNDTFVEAGYSITPVVLTEVAA